jgi:hypothetical protein
MFELWKLVSPSEGSQKKALECILEGRCKHHDLSKFSSAEVLGYYYKFVCDVPEGHCVSHVFEDVYRCRELFQSMLEESQKKPLEYILADYCQHNTLSKFTPTIVLGYDGGLITDNQAVQLWAQALKHHYCVLYSSPKQKNTQMSKAAMLESVFDMLAYRIQRNLRVLPETKVVEVCPEQLMSIPQKYLEKFGGQIDEINLYLFDWVMSLNKLMSEKPLACAGIQYETWTALVKWQSDKGVLLFPRKKKNLTDQERLIETSWVEDWGHLLAELTYINPR